MTLLQLKASATILLLSLGGKLAADLGIESSKTAIEAAGGFAKPKAAFDFDVDEWVRQWTSMSRAQQETILRRMDEIEEILRRSNEELAKRQAEHEATQQARAKEKAEHEDFLRRRREEEQARKQAEKEVEKAERERIKRVGAGIDPPRWDDLSDDHLVWLDRIEALDIIDDDSALLSLVRTGVRNGCLGLFGQSWTG